MLVTILVIIDTVAVAMIVIGASVLAIAVHRFSRHVLPVLKAFTPRNK